MIKILKNFSYTIFSNLGNALISMLVVFIIPKVISSYDYGMFQIFIFYFSYAGLIQFGWLDGIYLRYGGAYYQDLNKAVMNGQFRLYTVLQLIISFFIEIYAMLFLNKSFVILASLIVIGVFISNEKTFFQFLLQLTNRISEFSFSSILSALVYALLVIFFLGIGIHNYRFFIWANIIGQICALIYGIYSCKEIFLKKIKPRYDINEVRMNISAGIKISLSSIAGMLILGIVRLGVQLKWSVSTFGKVSLILSICNLLMLFINAASLVLFPILRRIDSRNMSKIYKSINFTFMPFLYLLLLFYYPAVILINYWLPQYRNILVFMAILFPLGLYQGKFEVLSNTFFKVWRMESTLLMINVISLIASGIFTLIFTIIFRNLSLLIFSIILTLAIRSFISDFIIFYTKNIRILGNFIEESIIVSVFIFTNTFVSWYASIVIYIILLTLMWLINKRKVMAAFRVLKSIDYGAIE